MDKDSSTTLDDRKLSSDKEKIDWLQRKILWSIEYMREIKSINRKKASSLKIATITMSGLGSILLGLQISGFDSIFRNLAFVLVTVVTLVNALEPFFNYRSLWIEQEKALAGFYKVKDDFEFYLAGTDLNNVDNGKLNQIYGELSEVWDKHNNAWLTHRKADMPTNYTVL